MKNLLFIIVLLFISKPDLIAKSCGVYQEYWYTSGISRCRLSSGLEVLHGLSPSTNPDDTCKTRVFACNNSGTPSTPSGASNLPDFVIYNETNTNGYPYSCSRLSSDPYAQNYVFKGVHGEGFYSCNSGTPSYLPNVDDVNPYNPDNPLTCSSGYELSFINGMSFTTNTTTGRKSIKQYGEYSCLKSNPSGSPFGEDADIGEDINFNEAYQGSGFIQAPQTFKNDDGSTTMILPDGTKQTIYNNGTLITEYPDGEIRVDNIKDLNKTPSNQSGTYIKHQAVSPSGDKYYEMNTGIKYLLEPNGTLTKVLNDLVIKENVNYNTWKPSQDHGFTGHLGTSAVGNGSGGSSNGSGSSTGNDKYLDGSNIGDTSNENNEGKPNEKEPIDEKEASKSCSDSSLSYQEKMLCEMNQGVKKLNQETNPENSANNLLSDLNYTTNRNQKAITYNLDNVAQSSGVSIVEQEKQNPKLENLNQSLGGSVTSLTNVDNSLKKIGQNIGVFNNSSNGSGSNGSGSNGSGSGSADLDKYLTGDGVSNVDGINNSNISTDSNINNLTSIFSNFKTNLFNSFNSINNQLDGLKNSISNPDNIFQKSTVYSCPISYDFNLISYGLGNKTITVDGCNYFSKLYSIGYFIVYLLASLSLIFFVFSLVGFII